MLKTELSQTEGRGPVFNQLITDRFALVAIAAVTSISPEIGNGKGSEGIFRVCQIAGMAIICGFILTASSYAFWAIT